MTNDVACRNCENVVSINAADVQHKLNDLLAIIQFETRKRVVSLSLLTVLDDCVECCDKPEYYKTY